MENNIKSFKIDRIIFAVGALVIGIILLVWPSTSLLIMGKCIGAFLAGGGIVAAFMFFQDHESVMKSVLLIMAAVMLICGIQQMVGVSYCGDHYDRGRDLSHQKRL